MSGPLSGRRVLVTRAKSQASALAEQIRAAGGEPVALSVIRIAPPDSWAPLDAAIARLHEYAWVVLTSTNGVAAFVGRVRDAVLPAGLRFAAVGSATAKALETAGLRVDLIPSEYRGAALPGALAQHLTTGDRVLMPRGDRADPALAVRLTELGAVVDDVVVYRTLTGEAPEHAAVLADLAAGRIDYVTFTSSSTVTGLLQVVGGPAALGAVRIASIGPETAKTAVAAGLTVHLIAQEATIPGLVTALCEDAARRT